MTSHVPTFRTLGLHAGYGDCINCGQRITREQWAGSECGQVNGWTPGAHNPETVGSSPTPATTFRDVASLLATIAAGLAVGGLALALVS